MLGSWYDCISDTYILFHTIGMNMLMVVTFNMTFMFLSAALFVEQMIISRFAPGIMQIR